MTEPSAVTPSENSVKSLLEKPLHQLTEDDIAQLTREDCRRYLKDKGMRRPSWNKSQAIQQVIMLKSLLETTPDGEAGPRKRLRILHQNHSCSDANAVLQNVPKTMRDDGEARFTSEELTAFSGKNLEERDVDSEPCTQRTKTVPPKVEEGQMTIFYCGKVNVYDDMPAEKAQAIMHIAASPLQFPLEQLVDDDARISRPLPCLNCASSKTCLDSPAVFSPTLQTVVEGSSTRKASVQRYLEKKKDRLKCRTKGAMGSCSNLEIYYNHPAINCMSSRTDIRPPGTLTRCSSADNHSVKNHYPSTGLSDKGV